MAGDWIKMRTNLTTSPHVIGIASTAKVSVPTAIGALFMLWSWASEHTTNGNARSVTQVWVDGYVGIDGFAQAMVEEDWLRITDKGIEFPRFDEHCSQTAKSRALTARRVAGHKKHVGNARVTLRALPREEKRREEVKTPCSSPKGNDEWANRIYEVYPKRVGRKAAITAIHRAAVAVQNAKSIPPVDAYRHLYAAARDFAKSPLGMSKGPDAQFIPHPATWFNQGRYDDDRSAWDRKPQGDPKTAAKPAIARVTLPEGVTDAF